MPRRNFEVCADGLPSEQAEQRVLAQWLDRFVGPYSWCWVPNGQYLPKARRGVSKAMGLKAGVPDIIVFGGPGPKQTLSGQSVEVLHPGAAIELKRRIGGKVSREQRLWLDSLKAKGFWTYVAKGADDAIRFLVSRGYGAPEIIR